MGCAVLMCLLLAGCLLWDGHREKDASVSAAGWLAILCAALLLILQYILGGFK